MGATTHYLIELANAREQWLVLAREKSLVWWQSVAIVSCCSLILSPSYAASMPYQASPSLLLWRWELSIIIMIMKINCDDLELSENMFRPQRIRWMEKQKMGTFGEVKNCQQRTIKSEKDKGANIWRRKIFRGEEKQRGKWRKQL